MTDKVDASSLLSAAQGGDADAFGELCRVHETRLFRQALALCGDPNTAEDLTQDTLIAAWKSVRRFNGRCQWFTWLCAIMIRQHRNRLRSRWSWTRFFAPALPADSAETLHEVPDPADGPATAVATAERDQLLRRCLADLPQKQREVIFLRFYVGESLEGIATALDCSVGTVKSRLFNGLEKLRRMRTLTVHFPEPHTDP